MPPQDLNNGASRQTEDNRIPVSDPANNGSQDDSNFVDNQDIQQSSDPVDQFASNGKVVGSETVQETQPITPNGNNDMDNLNADIPPVAEEISTNSTLEATETIPTQLNNQQTGTVNSPQETSKLEEGQSLASQERVSLTDLTSYHPDLNAQPSSTPQSVPVPDQDTKENIYTEICSQIIREQEQIIGALAVEQARDVVGLSVDAVTYHCTVTGDGSKVIDDLIEKYRDFFGHAAVEVCKEAAAKLLPKLPAEALPTSLR